MKKNFGKLLMVAFAALTLTSCGALTTKGGVGFVYSNTAEGENVTGVNRGSKVGTAKLTNILGVVVTGDASVEAAAKSAGIRKISHVDNKKKSILGVYSTYEVVVYGE